MARASAVRAVSQGESPRSVYDRIGRFLFDQRLDPDPANYSFAYTLLSDPNGPLAKAVAAMTDGGVRLTQKDVEQLGGDVSPAAAKKVAERADGLVARTQLQVEGFADIMDAMRAETAGFGRDLAASADAIRRGGDALDVDEVARITATMVERVRSAESRLESATHEASELRVALEEARDNARRDPLTNLPNRRAFEEAYAAQLASGAPICFGMCDVDHFKSINDRFGHVVGDRVLRAIADSLSKSCNGHLVARYGGEEFAILFSGITVDEAAQLMESARTAVSARHFRLRDTDEPLGQITVSGGLTDARPQEVYGTTFNRADQLLYAAKNAGRNRLHIG